MSSMTAVPLAVPAEIVFNKLLAVCRPLPDDACIHPAAAAIAHLTGADLLSTCQRPAVSDNGLAGLVEQVPAPVRPLRRVGDPAAELAELSQDLDLLVIGTRGRAPLRRALTGSVSRKLIATARCPLLIVPPQAAVAIVAM